MIRTHDWLILWTFALGFAAVPAAAQTNPLAGAGNNPAGRQVPATAQQQRNEQALKLLAERAFEQLDQIVPGEFPEGSTDAATLRTIIEMFSRGEFEAARAKLDALCAESPTLPPSGLLWSALLLGFNQIDAAYLELEKSAVTSADYPGIYTAFARLALTRQRVADALAQIKESRRAIDAGTWNDAQKKHFEMDFLDTSSEIASRRDQYDLARGYLEELRKYLPDNAMLLVRLADLDFRQDRIDAALQQLSAAHTMDPSDIPVPQLTLFQWYQRLGKTADAKQWMEQAVAEHPDDRTVQLDYGRYQLESGNPTEAAIWIDKAEKNGADPSAARFVRGQIAYYRGAFQAAEGDFKELNTQNPNDFVNKNMLALCLIESSEPARKQNALEVASFNLQSNPKNVYAASTLAWIYYRLGNQKQAVQMFDEVLRSPNVPTDAAYYVAHLFADEGQYEKALNLLQQSLAAPGLFLNRLRAQEFLKEIEQRMKQTPSADGNPPAGKQ